MVYVTQAVMCRLRDVPGLRIQLCHLPCQCSFHSTLSRQVAPPATRRPWPEAKLRAGAPSGRIWKTASSASHEPPLLRVQATAVAAKLRKELSAQQRQGPHPRRSRYEGRGGGVGLLSALGVPPGAAHSGEVFVSLP